MDQARGSPSQASWASTTSAWNGTARHATRSRAGWAKSSTSAAQNDLVFWHQAALIVATAVRGKRSFEIEQLVSDVYEALDDYPSAKIEKMWQTKQTAMTRILQANGGNKYNLHRTADRGEAGRTQ